MTTSPRSLAARLRRCFFTAAVFIALALPMPAGADGPGIAADQAYRQAVAGERLIIDVRTPQEWEQTGLPDTAMAVSLHHQDGPEGFLHSVLEAVDGDRAAPIALICRTGNRSQIARAYLVQAGFTNVQDISEGMAGGPNGRGWLPRGLPTEVCTQC